MSRSSYNDDGFESKEDQWAYICYRGAVKSAIRGKKGQAFIKEAIDALDKLESKELTSNELECEGQYCTLGAVGKSRGADMSNIDPEHYKQTADFFQIPDSLAREIMFENDDNSVWNEDNKTRFSRMRAWLSSLIIEPKKEPA